MGLLILDLARRNGRKAAFFIVLLMPMLWGASAMGDLTLAFRSSMGIAFALGPMTLRYVPQAIWYLPISRRDVWRGGWLVAIVGATVLTTAAKLVAVVALPGGASYGLASLVLSSVYDFAYVGIGCALVIAATRPRPARAPWRQVSALLTGLSEFALALGIPAALYLPGELPTHWADLTTRSGTALIAALALTIGTYFHSPSLPARLLRGGFLFTSAVSPARTPRAQSGIPRFELAGLSGLPRLLVHEYVWTLLIGGGLAVASVLVVLVAANLSRSQHTFADFLRMERLLLDGASTPPQASGLDAFALVIWYALFVASLAARFPAMLRHLRVLPLSARRVNALLVVWPAVIWLTVWTALLALHYVVVGRGFTSWHLALLAGLVGSSALVQALTLRLTGLLRVLCFSAAVGVVPFLGLFNVPPPGVLALLGISGLAAAAVLNHAALRRSSTYRHTGPAFGAHGLGVTRAG